MVPFNHLMIRNTIRLINYLCNKASSTSISEVLVVL